MFSVSDFVAVSPWLCLSLCIPGWLFLAVFLPFSLVLPLSLLLYFQLSLHLFLHPNFLSLFPTLPLFLSFFLSVSVPVSLSLSLSHSKVSHPLPLLQSFQWWISPHFSTFCLSLSLSVCLSLPFDLRVWGVTRNNWKRTTSDGRKCASLAASIYAAPAGSEIAWRINAKI